METWAGHLAQYADELVVEGVVLRAQPLTLGLLFAVLVFEHGQRDMLDASRLELGLDIELR